MKKNILSVIKVSSFVTLLNSNEYKTIIAGDSTGRTAPGRAGCAVVPIVIVPYDPTHPLPEVVACEEFQQVENN